MILFRHGSARTFALLSGGGTAGHVQPALAVAEALVARGHDGRRIDYVGRGVAWRRRSCPKPVSR